MGDEVKLHTCGQSLPKVLANDPRLSERSSAGLSPQWTYKRVPDAMPEVAEGLVTDGGGNCQVATTWRGRVVTGSEGDPRVLHAWGTQVPPRVAVEAEALSNDGTSE